MITYRFAVATKHGENPEQRLATQLGVWGVTQPSIAPVPDKPWFLEVAFQVPDDHDWDHNEWAWHLGRVDGVTTARLYGMQADLAVVPFWDAITGRAGF